MHECTNARMQGCTDARMHGCTDARTEYAGSEWLDRVPMGRAVGLQRSARPASSAFRCLPAFLRLCIPAFLQSAFLHFCVSAFPFARLCVCAFAAPVQTKRRRRRGAPPCRRTCRKCRGLSWSGSTESIRSRGHPRTPSPRFQTRDGRTGRCRGTSCQLPVRAQPTSGRHRAADRSP
jgi:hypothetical protein